MPQHSWNLKQRLHFRVSTALLLYMPFMLAITLTANYCKPYIPGSVIAKLIEFLMIGPFATLIGSLIALGYFAVSLFKRNPQAQFLVESTMIILYLGLEHL